MRRASGLAFTVSVLWAFSGCGSSDDDEPTGSALVLITDQPLDDLLSFEITLTDVVFDPGGVSILPSPERIELTALRMDTGILRLAEVPPGSYDSVTVRFADPTVRFLEGGVVREVDPPLRDSSVSDAVAFTVAENGGVAVLIDFDVDASIETDPMGDVTGVDPTISVSRVGIGGSDEIEDRLGRVLAISRTGAMSGTLGQVLFEDFTACSGTITVTVTSSTVFDGFAPAQDSFASLVPGHLIELDADFRSDGTVIAEEIELEDDEDEDRVEGLIVEVDRAADGLVLAFDLVPLAAAPCSAALPSAARVEVTVSPATAFRIDDDGFDVETVDFNDPRDIDVGQKVSVDPSGAITGNTTAMVAERIRLQDQTIHGAASSVTDPLTTFGLAPSSELFPDVLISVETSARTEVEDPPENGQDVRVKGLLLRTGPGEQRLVAKRVDGTP